MAKNYKITSISHKRRREAENERKYATKCYICGALVILSVAFLMRVNTLATADKFESLRYSNGAFTIEGEVIEYPGLKEGHSYDVLMMTRTDNGKPINKEDWFVVKAMEAKDD